MSSTYKLLLRPLLFRLDAERIHHSSVEACRIAGYIPMLPSLVQLLQRASAAELQSTVVGIKFDNPIGLAAGWDKSGRALRMLARLGFGSLEIGSISARPSSGNTKPRLFRLPQDRAIVVNYGLPNDGADAVAHRLAQHMPLVPLGVNIVATNDGPAAPLASAEQILEDYRYSVRAVQQHCNYITLNLSCPNAAGGKDFFTEPGNITRLLEQLQPLGITCPVFLKVPPYGSAADQTRWLDECSPFSFVRGFTFNLPAGKPASLKLRTSKSIWQNMPGAVSGQPVEALINECIASLYNRMDRQRYAIIGSGGVFTAEDAYRKIRLGASLIQIYTSLVYEGPSVVGRINRDLVRLLKRDGFKNIRDAIGADT